jgi:hypothetical protein
MRDRRVRAKITISIPIGACCIEGYYKCKFLAGTNCVTGYKLNNKDIHELHCGYFNTDWLVIEDMPLKCFQCYWNISPDHRYGVK